MRETVVASMTAETEKLLRKREKELENENLSSMDSILKPLKESISAMEKAMKENASSHLETTTKLSEQLKNAVKEMQEKVAEIVGELVELVFDDSMPNCIVPHCHKPDSIGCGHRICIDENKAIWLDKIDQIAKEMLEGKK
jgi:uncharacterized protein YlxW (UPF0749 family)